jgi:hypothetical protein
VTNQEENKGKNEELKNKQTNKTNKEKRNIIFPCHTYIYDTGKKKRRNLIHFYNVTTLTSFYWVKLN